MTGTKKNIYYIIYRDHVAIVDMCDKKSYTTIMTSYDFHQQHIKTTTIQIQSKIRLETYKMYIYIYMTKTQKQHEST